MTEKWKTVVLAVFSTLSGATSNESGLECHGIGHVFKHARYRSEWGTGDMGFHATSVGRDGAVRKADDSLCDQGFQFDEFVEPALSIL
ncbi:MAG: hypothetical protein M3252_02095 [Actinomycetota bacterium]|nr:hypothetical protein [Actinomycetota bacterium]